MTRLRLFLLGALAAVGLLVPVVALAGTSTLNVSASIVRGGNVSRLKIVANGHTAYDNVLRARACGGNCITTPVTPGRSSVRIAGLQTGSSLDVVAGLYSGGAHCCFIDQVFSRRGSTLTYAQSAQHNFLDAGANLVRRNGRWEFDSADARVAENAFTDYADSGMPLQIWRVSHGRFVDITRGFPARISTDAARWYKAYRQHRSNGVGFIAAWAADEDLLGHKVDVNRTLQALARRHQLHSALGLPHNSETAFIHQLEAFLHQLGYTR